VANHLAPSRALDAMLRRLVHCAAPLSRRLRHKRLFEPRIGATGMEAVSLSIGVLGGVLVWGINTCREKASPTEGMKNNC
jgi:hypothetical protein